MAYFDIDGIFIDAGDATVFDHHIVNACGAFRSYTDTCVSAAFQSAVRNAYVLGGAVHGVRLFAATRF
jgi:hypothetical protein